MPTPLPPAQREDLRQKAQQATPGPYISSGYNIIARGQIIFTATGRGTDNQGDAAYIAAAHPAVILSLLAERDDLTRQLADQEVEKLELVKEIEWRKNLLAIGVSLRQEGEALQAPARLTEKGGQGA